LALAINALAFRGVEDQLELAAFRDLSSYDVFCLIHKCVSLLKIATLDDITFLFRALFKAQFSAEKVKKLSSILVGAEYLVPIGGYGHYYANPAKSELLTVRP
jgi:hypothetical protein